MESTLTAVGTRVLELEEAVTSQAKRISDLEEQRDRLLDEIRKSNLLIHGLKEPEKEDEDSLNAAVLETFDKTGVQVKIDDPFRIGKKTPGKIRPVKVRIPFYSQKLKVLRAKKVLEDLGKRMYITQDLTLSTRLRRKKYYEETQTNANTVVPRSSQSHSSQ